MDEPVPIRRAAVGCLLIALAGLAVALLVRPAIFYLAPPRDDSAVVVATAAEVFDGPVLRDVLLTRSYGWDGERDAGRRARAAGRDRGARAVRRRDRGGRREPGEPRTAT